MQKNNSKTDSKNQKKVVGIFSFTCDEGCSIYLIEIFNKKLVDWLKKIDLHYFLSVKEKQPLKEFDIALVEGVINTKRELQEIKEIREKTKVLIGMGSCAITGQPSGQRNLFSPEQEEEIADDLNRFDFLPKALSVKEAVGLDDEVPGCPMDELKFIEIFEKYLDSN